MWLGSKMHATSCERKPADDQHSELYLSCLGSLEWKGVVVQAAVCSCFTARRETTCVIMAVLTYTGVVVDADPEEGMPSCIRVHIRT